MARRVGGRDADRSSLCLGKVRSWPLPWQRSGRAQRMVQPVR
jgi:hypothetical protein